MLYSVKYIKYLETSSFGSVSCLHDFRTSRFYLYCWSSVVSVVADLRSPNQSQTCCRDGFLPLDTVGVVNISSSDPFKAKATNYE